MKHCASTSSIGKGWRRQRPLGRSISTPITTIKRCGTPVDRCRHLGLVLGVPPAELAQWSHARSRKTASEVNQGEATGCGAWYRSSGVIIWCQRPCARGADQGIDGRVSSNFGNQRAIYRGIKHIECVQKGWYISRDDRLSYCGPVHNA